MVIYDCFIYNGEFKMLNFRLHELRDLVDYFVIAESDHTFKGDKRELAYPEQRKAFDTFESKIIYLRHSAVPHPDPWANETDLRNHLAVGLLSRKLYPEDVIVLSDVDEIPDTCTLERIRRVNFSGIGTFYQNFHYYNLRCRSTRKWCGSTFFNYGSGYLKLGFQQLRENRHHLPKVGSDGDFTSGGWHLSYFGDPQAIIQKIRSFSHQEFNRPRYTDPKVIEDCIRNGRDLLFRKEEQFETIDNPTYVPKHASLLD